MQASQLQARRHGSQSLRAIFSDWPLQPPLDGVRLVNQVMSEKETEELRTCVARNRPYGAERWQTDVAKRLGLSQTLRNEAQPKATSSVQNKSN